MNPESGLPVLRPSQRDSSELLESRDWMLRARARGDLATTRNPGNSSRVSFGANIWSSWNSYTLGRIMSRALRRRRSDNHSSRENRIGRTATRIFSWISMNRRSDLTREKDKFRETLASDKERKFNKLASLWAERGRERERDKEKRGRAFIRRMQLRVATSDRRAVLRAMHRRRRRRRHPVYCLSRCSLHRDSSGYTLVFGTSGRCYRELTRTSHWFRDLRNTLRVRYDVPVTNYALDLDS